MFSYNGEGISQQTLDKINQASNYNHYLPPAPLGPINMSPYLHLHDQNFPYQSPSMMKESYQTSSSTSRIPEVQYPDFYRPPAAEFAMKNNRHSIDLRFNFDNDSNVPTKIVAQNYDFNYPTYNNIQTNHINDKIESTKNQEDHNFESKLDSNVEDVTKTNEECSTVINYSVTPEEPKINNESVATVSTKECEEVDYKNPYIRDTNGLKSEQVDKSLNVIEGNEATDAALAAVSNTGPESKVIYKCDDCSLHFIHPKRFLIHNKWHLFGQTLEKKRQIREEKQQKKLARKKVQTPEVVTEENGVQCEICGAWLGSSRKLQAHRLKKHADLPRPCIICHKTFERAEEAEEHLKCHLDDGDSVRFACDECPKTFKGIYSLLRHSEVHKEKLFPCDQCDRKFGSSTRLKSHKRNHEKYLKGTTHHCSYCGKGFYEAYTLQAHERTHRNERPFTCNLCHGSYGTNSTLKKHMLRSHSSEHPYSCTVCHRCFSTEKSLQRHVSAAHDEGPRRRRRKKPPV